MYVSVRVWILFVSVWLISASRQVLLVVFFQAEDGIRDYKVTGVQTCALPIWRLIGT